jgi:hypothetical protein
MLTWIKVNITRIKKLLSFITKPNRSKISPKKNLPVSYNFFSYQKIYIKKAKKWINRPTFTYRNRLFDYFQEDYYREILPYRGDIASIYLDDHRLVKFQNHLHRHRIQRHLEQLELALKKIVPDQKDYLKENIKALQIWDEDSYFMGDWLWLKDFEDDRKSNYYYARAKNVYLKVQYREEIVLLIDAVKRIRNILLIESFFLKNPNIAYKDYLPNQSWSSTPYILEEMLGIPFISIEELQEPNFPRNETVVHNPALISYIDEIYDNLVKIKDKYPINDNCSFTTFCQKRIDYKLESLIQYYNLFKEVIIKNTPKKIIIIEVVKRILTISLLALIRPIIYPLYLLLILQKKKDQVGRASFPNLRSYLLDKWYRYQNFNLERDIYHITNKLKGGLFNIFFAIPIRFFLIKYFGPYHPIPEEFFFPPLFYMKAVERCFQKELAAETIVSHSILATRQSQINESPLIPPPFES